MKLNKKTKDKTTTPNFDSESKRSNSAIGSFFGFNSVNNINLEGSPLRRRPSLGESAYGKSSPRTTSSPRNTNSPRFLEKLISPRTKDSPRRTITSPRKFQLKAPEEEDFEEINQYTLIPRTAGTYI